MSTLQTNPFKSNIILPMLNTGHHIIDRFFDWHYGLETTETVELKHMDILGPNRVHGKKYQPTRVLIFQKAMRALVKLVHDLRPFHFIDIGCGKGRCTILASLYPFQSLLGVDFAVEMISVANSNWEKYGREHKNLPPTNFILQDATKANYPKGHKVFYLFNPFNNYVLSLFLEHVVQNKTDNELVFIVLSNPIREYVFDMRKNFHLHQHIPNINHNNSVNIYQLKGPLDHC